MEREREYSRLDALILGGSALVIVVSFMLQWRAVVESRVPEAFSVGIFLLGVVAGTARFVWCEGRARRVAVAARATSAAPERG